ncbi:MAG: hypothetical protein ACTSYM_03890 [Candidatus Baldrarchaeia archaeon]
MIMLVPMAILAFLTVLLGFYPDLVLKLISPVAEEMGKLISG